MHSSVSTAIVMAVLFASAYFFSNRFNIGTLYRSPLVLIVCGFLLVPVEGVFGTAASSYLISMSYSLVGIIVALLLYDISKRLGVTVVIFAAIKGAEQVFVIWGKGVAEAMVAAGMNAGAQDAVIAVAVVAMMLAATLILLSEKELASRWGVRILDAAALWRRPRKSCGATSGRPSWPSTPASPRGKPRFWRWWPRARTARPSCRSCSSPRAPSRPT